MHLTGQAQAQRAQRNNTSCKIHDAGCKIRIAKILNHPKLNHEEDEEKNEQIIRGTLVLSQLNFGLPALKRKNS
jgi:hypothetical protein